MSTITSERLREMIEYNPDTGSFSWRVRPSKRSRRMAGDEAGTVKLIGGNHHRYIGIDGRGYLAPQLAWFYVTGSWPDGRVACQNGDQLDVRFSNLVKMPGVKVKFDFKTPDGRAAYLRAHRVAHPEHYKHKDLKRDFGVMLAQYREMLLKQNGVCAICEKPETATLRGKLKHLAVDHDHGTGVIRDLLCAHCNTALGKFNENIEILQRAIAYLRRHKGTADTVVALVKKETA